MKRMKKFLLVVVFFLSVLNVFGEDILSRIISVAPSVTESLFYMGYGKQIVGRTSLDTYPPEIKNIEVIGDMSNQNAEKVIALKPQIVIFSSFANEKLLKVLADKKIKTLVFQTPTSVDEMFQQMETMNKTLGYEKVAQSKINILKDKINSYKEKSKTFKKRPKIYLSLGAEQVEFTSGKGTFIDDGITIAGGDNIVKSAGWSIPLETLIVSQPDIIIAEQIVYDTMKNNPKYKDLKAIKEGDVIIIPSALLNSVPRFVTEVIPTIQAGIEKYYLKKTSQITKVK